MRHLQGVGVYISIMSSLPVRGAGELVMGYVVRGCHMYIEMHMRCVVDCPGRGLQSSLHSVINSANFI